MFSGISETMSDTKSPLFSHWYGIVADIQIYVIIQYDWAKYISLNINIQTVIIALNLKLQNVHSEGLETFLYIFRNRLYVSLYVGLSGLGVPWSPRDPRFAGSKPAEVDGFFQDVKILSTSPPGGTLSRGSRVWDFRLVKEPQAWKNRPLRKI